MNELIDKLAEALNPKLWAIEKPGSAYRDRAREQVADLLTALRRNVTPELAAQAGRYIPGICGTSSTNGGQWEPFGLYADDRKAEALAGVMRLFTDAVLGITVYRPSNGSEGNCFQGEFCSKCARDRFNIETGDGESCPILTDSYVHDATDAEYPREWRYGPDGRPTCTAFALKPELSQ